MEKATKDTAYYCNGCDQYFNILTGLPEKPPEDPESVTIHHIRCKACYEAYVADLKRELDALEKGPLLLRNYPADPGSVEIDA